MVFRAEGERGVTVTDIANWEDCSVNASIPFEKPWVGSVVIFKNTLAAFNSQHGSALYNLDKLFPGKKVAEPDPLPYEKAGKLFSLEKTDAAKPNREQLQALLYKAAEGNDAKQATTLCEMGADPNEKGHDSHNPIEISSMLGNLEALQALLECDGVPTGWSMISAALNEEIESMKLLAKYGADLGQADEDGCTTLHYIAQDGSLEMVKYLVSKGVPHDVTCRGNETPLTWAGFGKNEEVMEFLQNL
jgi:ankyrin repeat protein